MPTITTHVPQVGRNMFGSRTRKLRRAVNAILWVLHTRGFWENHTLVIEGLRQGVAAKLERELQPRELEQAVQFCCRKGWLLDYGRRGYSLRSSCVNQLAA